jgi:hypothetical protein
MCSLAKCKLDDHGAVLVGAERLHAKLGYRATGPDCIPASLLKELQ